MIGLGELKFGPRRWIEVSRDGGRSWRNHPHSGRRYSWLCAVNASTICTYEATNGWIYPPQ